MYTWTLGATRPRSSLLITSPGLPFDLLDAGASFRFGCVFAPELARVLARMRARIDVAERPPVPVRRPAPRRGGLAGAVTLPGGSARAGVMRPLGAPPAASRPSRPPDLPRPRLSPRRPPPPRA